VLHLTQESPVVFSHIDVDGRLDNPPILAATLISTSLLILALARAAQLWHRLNGWNVGRRIILVLLGCAIYLMVGVIQIALGEAFYRAYEHIDPSVSVGLYVPVACVAGRDSRCLGALHNP
jgi:hypothetical protein